MKLQRFQARKNNADGSKREKTFLRFQTRENVHTVPTDSGKTCHRCQAREIKRGKYVTGAKRTRTRSRSRARENMQLVITYNLNNIAGNKPNRGKCERVGLDFSFPRPLFVVTVWSRCFSRTTCCRTRML